MQAHTYFPPLSLSLIIVGGKKRKRKEEDGFEIGGKGGSREEGVQLYGRMCYSRRQRRNWKGCKEYFVISVSYSLCSVVFVVVGGRVLGFVPLTIGGRGLCKKRSISLLPFSLEVSLMRHCPPHFFTNNKASSDICQDCCSLAFLKPPSLIQPFAN